MAPGEKTKLLQKCLVEQRWELQDSTDGNSMRISDPRREIQSSLIEIGRIWKDSTGDRWLQ